jgi:hypothetical protein
MHVDADSLKSSISLRDYVEARLGAPYKKEGRCWVWNTPFRNTTGNSPSFKVWDTYMGGAGYCKDYGSGETYDVYRFIQELDGISFRDAVQSLNEWANGGTVARIHKNLHADSPKQSFKQFTWDDIRKAELHYPHVRPYIELKRKISGQVAHDTHLGGITWSKLIEYNGKTERIPVNRATFPYYFNGAVHGWASRRDDLTFLERIDWEFRGIVEHTRNLVWQNQLKTNSDAKLPDVTDSMVIDAIHNDMWTPKEKRDKFNYGALLRWHEPSGSRRSIFNVDPFCRIENGIYKWNVNSIIVNESEVDALAVQSVCSKNTASIAYKYTNHLRTPFWKVLGNEPIIVYIAVQNDIASLKFARELAQRLEYSKENYGVSKYVVQYLHTLQGYKDFSQMHEAGALKGFFENHPIGTCD